MPAGVKPNLLTQNVDCVNKLEAVVKQHAEHQKRSGKRDHWHKNFISELLVEFVVDVLNFSNDG